MNDQERFEAFKKDAVQKNEEAYGQEIRSRYGDEEVDACNQKMLNMTKEEYQRFQALSQELNDLLKTAMRSGEKPVGMISCRFFMFCNSGLDSLFVIMFSLFCWI